MNLNKIFDSIRESKWHAFERSLIGHITDALFKRCKHDGPTHKPKVVYPSLQSVYNFLDKNKDKIESGAWAFAPQVAYYCPSCGGWHTTTHPLDSDYIEKIQSEDMQFYNSTGRKPLNCPPDGDAWYVPLSSTGGHAVSKHEGARNRRDFKNRESIKRDKELQKLIRLHNPDFNF